jgi:prepilin-type N-terminal cleavage/methylation domain-containing protein
MKKAFTIVELLVVVAVIAVLMGIAGVAYSGAIKNGRAKRAQAMIVALQAAIDTYRARYDEWPPQSLDNKLSGGNLQLNVRSAENPDEWDPNLYELSADEVASAIRQIVKVSAGQAKGRANPLVDISSLFVARSGGEKGGNTYGMDFWTAAKGDKRTDKIPLASMIFGYPRKADNKFRRFRMIYSIPTDTITIKKMEDGDF